MCCNLLYRRDKRAARFTFYVTIAIPIVTRAYISAMLPYNEQLTFKFYQECGEFSMMYPSSRTDYSSSVRAGVWIAGPWFRWRYDNDADTFIDVDGSWIGWDYRRVSRVMLFPCFSSAPLKGVLWSGLSHYEATVWCRWEEDGHRWMDHLRFLRRLICISNSSVRRVLLQVAITANVCYLNVY